MAILIDPHADPHSIGRNETVPYTQWREAAAIQQDEMQRNGKGRS